jgi:hypothetical protein
MNKLNLSVDELIYCLYSEGFFEQGMALKTSLLEELSDEQFEIVLQVSCRTLLAKGYINFDEGKFTVTDDVRKFIKFVSFAEVTYQGAKALTQEFLTIHQKQGEYLIHTVLYDGQVHNLELVKHEEAINRLKQFFAVSDHESNSFTVEEEKFAHILKSFDELEMKFTLPNLTESEKQLYNKLEKTEGFLNTLLVITYTEKNEPIAQDVVLFTATEANNLAIVKEENGDYVIHNNTNKVVKEFVK